MRRYAHYGFRRFVLCLGYRAEVIRDYFINYAVMNSDFTVKLKTNEVRIRSVEHDDDWEVTLGWTGEKTMTGARIARAASRYLDGADMFAVTYGDGLTDANLAEEVAFHIDHGRLGTVLGVSPPGRFGEIRLNGDEVVAFEEKPRAGANWINGGYFLFARGFLEYLDGGQNCVLEGEPLVRLAEERELSMYRHNGFWACMDTQRDCDRLNEMWARGDAPWKV
jgi:glucose-1-phosphate cytidylyltransferase